MAGCLGCICLVVLCVVEFSSVSTAEAQTTVLLRTTVMVLLCLSYVCCGFRVLSALFLVRRLCYNHRFCLQRSRVIQFCVVSEVHQQLWDAVQVSMAAGEPIADRTRSDLPASKHLILLVCTLLECLPFLEGSSDSAVEILSDLIMGPPCASSLFRCLLFSASVSALLPSRK